MFVGVNLSQTNVRMYLNILRNIQIFFNPTEWKLLESEVSLLKPVRDTIEDLEAEKEPTMHRIVERIYTMHCMIDEIILKQQQKRYQVRQRPKKDSWREGSQTKGQRKSFLV